LITDRDEISLASIRFSALSFCTEAEKICFVNGV
jgi:hypothetical protein